MRVSIRKAMGELAMIAAIIGGGLVAAGVSQAQAVQTPTQAAQAAPDLR